MEKQPPSPVPPGSPWLARRSLLTGAVLAPWALAACGAEEKEPPAADRERRLTAAEAEGLALTRFRLHREKRVPVLMEWPGGQELAIAATLDLAAGIAWGKVEGETDRLIGWSTKIITTAAVPASGEPVPGNADWTTRQLTTGVVQDIFLLLALTLGTDRPENPALLQQGSARFLRRDEVDGRAVSVISGPRPASEGADADGSRTRFWIDDEGDLQRFEAYLGDAEGRFARLTRTDDVPQVAGLADRVADVLRIAGGPNR